MKREICLNFKFGNRLALENFLIITTVASIHCGRTLSCVLNWRYNATWLWLYCCITQFATFPYLKLASVIEVGGGKMGYYLKP